MIGRKVAKRLAEVYRKRFLRVTRDRTYGRDDHYSVDGKEFHDFLYERDYEPWLLEIADSLNYSKPRDLEEFVMGLQTGRSLALVTRDWTIPERQDFGQRILVRFAEDILREAHEPTTYAHERESRIEVREALLLPLELDGYIYRSGKLYQSDKNVLNEEQEANLLLELINVVRLDNALVMDHHLKMSETQYLDGHWWDSIGNARAFFEEVLKQVAIKYSREHPGDPIDDNPKAVDVRLYLEKVGLFSHSEIMAIKEVYALLSESGNHPHISEQDQARMMRNLSLTLSSLPCSRHKKCYRLQTSRALRVTAVGHCLHLDVEAVMPVIKPLPTTTAP